MSILASRKHRICFAAKTISMVLNCLFGQAIASGQSMDRVFIAHSFSDADRPLVQRLGDIVHAFGATPVTGRRLGGAVLTQEIKSRISDADALIALCTYREDKSGWPTHPWVLAEFGFALELNKPCIALVDSRVAWDKTPYPDREYIPFDAGAPYLALLDMVEHLGVWRADAGAPIQLLIDDEEIIRAFLTNRRSFQVRYRCGREARFSQFRDTDRVMLDAGGLVITLPTVPSRDHHVEVEISADRAQWICAVSRQYISVKLERVNS
ncbi:hypothetical protein FJ962_16100 [Mesorhizobium sp. B2-1-9]|nr:hypothetical protein FJ551_09245 [Mesorhizobium sp. B2-5-1]TPM60652.1 hypothetical protein FJ962_16100 [Mesorhizobium sp. B2-1-9]TPN11063.1 hypothetical protein FJ971_13265 [Mesorhizobium sp. B2-1-2]